MNHVDHMDRRLRQLARHGCDAATLVVAVVSGLATAATATPDMFMGDIPVMIEEAVQAGITQRYDGPWEYFVGGGVSSFDCNQDRLPDLYIAGGVNAAALYVNQSRTGQPLSFQRQVDTSLELTRVVGSYPLDIDNDGYLDLAVLRVGENRLFRGGPDCSFTPANITWHFNGGSAWTTAFSATFEAGQSYPTLAFGNYVDRAAPGSPWGTCHGNELHRPSALADKAVPDYTDALPLVPGYCALSMLFTDWNKSGVDALRMTNDRQYYRDGQEQLWRLDAGRYPRLYSSSEGWQPLVIWGMGIAEADLNADGYPEYALTSMGDTKLQVLDLQQAIEENRPGYEDMAWDRGVTAHRPYTGEDLKPSTGWHAQFEDVNNDGRLDLFITKGNVERMTDFARFDPDNLLLGTHDGRFSEHGLEAGIALDRRGRGAGIADFNADGLLDIVVVNRADNVSLFRNAGMAVTGSTSQLDTVPTTSTTTSTASTASTANGTADPQSSATLADTTRPGGNWLKLEIAQPGVNRNAIGAHLSVKTGNLVQTRRLQVGGGHASGHAGFIHVGLGVAERATVRVQWPDGEWSAPFQLFANQHVLLERGRDSVVQWFPRPAADTGDTGSDSGSDSRSSLNIHSNHR